MTDSDAFFADVQVDDLINEALAAISVEEDWPWLGASTTFSTVSGTQSYTPPSDWARTKSLCIDGYSPMEWRPLADIREAADSTSNFVDVPRFYTVWAEELLLGPKPGGAYTVRHDYIVSETALVADTDEPLMPAAFHYSIVAFAAHLASYRDGNLQRGAACLADYAAWKARMLGQRRRQSGPVRVRIRPGRSI